MLPSSHLSDSELDTLHVEIQFILGSMYNIARNDDRYLDTEFFLEELREKGYTIVKANHDTSDRHLPATGKQE